MIVLPAAVEYSMKGCRDSTIRPDPLGAGKYSAREIREYFIPDFQNWEDPGAYEEGLEKLLRDLKAPATATDSASG